MAFYRFKKNKLWLLKAVDRDTRKVISWVLGGRDIETVRRLYKKLEHLDAIFYTDNWNAFCAVLPKDRHIIGKKYTQTIESNNSNTRHHLARFTRKSKVVSKKTEFVDLSIETI